MTFVYIFIGLIIALLLIAAVLPGVYNIEKTIIIKKPTSDVMKQVGNFNNYSLWNPWLQMEPSASKIITGPPGTPGHSYAWQGKKRVFRLIPENRDVQTLH